MKAKTEQKVFKIMFAVIFLFAVSSCEYAREHEREATGAGIGAAAGTAGGLLLGGGAKGAIAGGLIGALAGGAVAHYTGEKNKGENETARQYNYQSSQGTVVRIERGTASPQTISPGETVDLRMTYALLTPSSGQEQNVTEKWEIRHNGELVGDPRVNVTRTGGTYTASLPLQLPRDAEAGTYNVTSVIQTADARDTATTSFRVR